MARRILGCTLQLGNKLQKTGRQDEFCGRCLHPAASGKQQQKSEYRVWGQLTVCQGWSAKRNTLSTTLSKLLVKHKPKSQGGRKSVSASKILTLYKNLLANAMCLAVACQNERVLLYLINNRVQILDNN